MPKHLESLHPTCRFWLSVVLSTGLFAQAVRTPDSSPPVFEEDAKAKLSGHGKRTARVHDPSNIVKCNSQYWFFATGTGVHSWRSKNLKEWTLGPKVFPEIPDWVRSVVPTQRGHFWAPDIIFHNGRYLLYYSISRFGRNTSAIALASNPTLDPDDPAYKWSDEGIVIQSGVDDDYNTIDPAVTKTDDGDLWLSFGSFWSGIKLIQLDPSTGKRLETNSRMQALASSETIEAPYIYHSRDYYYLFVNWGRCCRGVNSTYNIRVGRSRAITGPYLDKEGVDLLNGGGTLLLETDGPFIGPGHANILEENGRFWFSCHYYDGTEDGKSMLAIRPMSWGEDGWPVIEFVTSTESEVESAHDRPKVGRGDFRMRVRAVRSL